MGRSDREERTSSLARAPIVAVRYINNGMTVVVAAAASLSAQNNETLHHRSYKLSFLPSIVHFHSNS